MDIYNLVFKKELIISQNFTCDPNALYFIKCTSAEINELQSIFHFDMSTLIDCLNFDENIRLNSFQDYDFISIIYFKLKEYKILLNEINLYIGKNYIVMVLQDNDDLTLELLGKIMAKIHTTSFEARDMNRLYYAIFDILLTDLSDTMEKMEDIINEIDKQLFDKLGRDQHQLVSLMRENVYKIRKQLRPLLYVGDQVIVNESKLISPENMRYFNNIDIRINKLYDFSISLQEFTNHLLYMYDTKLTMQTNEVINKLTTLTLFFGPLTVITGVYGMNFVHMPELEWQYGYPFTLGIMFCISLIIFIILKVKKWL